MEDKKNPYAPKKNPPLRKLTSDVKKGVSPYTPRKIMEKPPAPKVTR